jgi:hypothetical protein
VELSGFDLPVDGAGRDARQAGSFVCRHHADALPARPAPTLRRDPAPADGRDAVRLDGDLCASFRKPVSLLPNTLRVAIMSASALPRPASCAKISAVVIDPVPCITFDLCCASYSPVRRKVLYEFSFISRRFLSELLSEL